MRFLYRYQDREKGVVEGEVAASSEAEAYATLRKGGIRPMSVWVKPGVLNRLSSIGKRGLAIVLLSFAVAALAFFAFRSPRLSNSGPAEAVASVGLEPLPRQQVPAVQSDFKYVTERTLELFVRPGEIASLPASFDSASLFSDIEKALATPIVASASDSPELILLKRVVSGLKSEVALALETGDTPEGILKWLVERQKMENAYRKGVIEEMKRQTDTPTASAKSEANATLRAMRLKEVSPEDL